MRCRLVAWYGEPNAIGNAINYAKPFSRSHNAVIRVYDEAGNVIEEQRAQGRFQRVVITSHAIRAISVCFASGGDLFNWKLKPD
jgi:hypothetical protein